MIDVKFTNCRGILIVDGIIVSMSYKDSNVLKLICDGFLHREPSSGVDT